MTRERDRIRMRCRMGKRVTEAIYTPIHLEGRDFAAVVGDLLQLRLQMGTKIGGLWDGDDADEGDISGHNHACDNECRLRRPFLKARARFIKAQERALRAIDEMVRVFSSRRGGCPPNDIHEGVGRGVDWLAEKRAKAVRNKRARAVLDTPNKRS